MATIRPYCEPDISRLLTALRAGKPDRVPNFEVLIEQRNVDAILGRPVGDHTLGKMSPEDYIALVRAIGQDAIGLNFFFDWPCPFYMVDKQGNRISPKLPISTAEQLEQLHVPQPEDFSERFMLLERYAEAVEGTNIGLFIITGCFFTLAYDKIFGFENFMLKTADDPGLLDSALERLAQFYEAVIRKALEFPISFLYLADDIAYKSGLMISPALLRDLWKKRMGRLMRPAVEKGIPILFHSDGNIFSIIPELVEMGVNALNPIEPACMDIVEVYRQWGGQLGLVGNIDVGSVLSSGSPEQVQQAARQLFETVGGKGGFVLASSHTITNNIPPENFRALYQTAWELVY